METDGVKEVPGRFKPGNAYAWKPGQSGSPTGAKKRPSLLICPGAAHFAPSPGGEGKSRATRARKRAKFGFVKALELVYPIHVVGALIGSGRHDLKTLRSFGCCSLRNAKFHEEAAL